MLSVDSGVICLQRIRPMVLCATRFRTFRFVCDMCPRFDVFVVVMINAKVVCFPIFYVQVQIRTRMAQIDSVSIWFGVVFAELHWVVLFRVSVFFLHQMFSLQVQKSWFRIIISFRERCQQESSESEGMLFARYMQVHENKVFVRSLLFSVGVL